MKALGIGLRGGIGLLVFGALAACASSGKEEGTNSAAAAALADDAIIGSCLAKDGSTCEEYQNQKGLKATERDVEIGLTKGACGAVKEGEWRDGKACDKKGELGHCVSDKSGSLKRTSFAFKGDEEMIAASCTTLTEGKWESGLADDALLGSCTSGTGCGELRNNKAVPTDSRQRLLAGDKESCERLEGEFSTTKGCEAAKATATCIDKDEGELTRIRYELSNAKQALEDAKELCAIGSGKFEIAAPGKK